MPLLSFLFSLHYVCIFHPAKNPAKSAATPKKNMCVKERERKGMGDETENEDDGKEKKRGGK